MANNNKTLLLLAGAGVGAYFLLNKSTSTASTANTANASLPNVAYNPTDTAAAAAATGVPATVVAAAASTSAAAVASVPDDVAQLALTASVDLLTTLAVVQYDAIIYGHPTDYSTRYFLANQDTWNGAYAAYQASGIPDLAKASGLDPVATLAVVAFDATLYNHPTQLSTSVFLSNREAWQATLVKFQQSKGMSGLAGGYYSPQGAGALPAVASVVAPMQAPAMAG